MSEGIEVELDFTELDRIARELPGQVDRAIKEAAFTAEQEAKMLMSTTSHTGRTYQRGRGQHTASAPGEPPAIDTGALINSLHVERRGQADYEFTDGVEYGVDLEFGHRRGGVYVAARPWMLPAVEYVKSKFDGIVKRVVKW